MFEERLQGLISRIATIKDSIGTEEATKTSLVMPFFQLLGYDVFNPLEFVPEFTADVGIKKGEKVDYAICQEGQASILIEAKCINQELEKHDSQLFRYFGTTTAKFGILTNGIVYKFFTDLDEPNKMDSSPFLEINLLDINDVQINEVKKFQKEVFDVSKIFDTASELKYLGMIKKVLKNELVSPSDEFVKFILNSDVYDGVKTQGIIEKYRPIIKKSVTQYINDLVNDKIKTALINNDTVENETKSEVVNELIEAIESEHSVETTEEEVQAYYIVKSILGQSVDMERITYKDTMYYFGMLLDDKVTKWICRLYIKERVKYVTIPAEKEVIKYTLTSIEDLYKLSDQIKVRLSELL